MGQEDVERGWALKVLPDGPVTEVKEDGQHFLLGVRGEKTDCLGVSRKGRRRLESRRCSEKVEGVFSFQFPRRSRVLRGSDTVGTLTPKCISGVI